MRHLQTKDVLTTGDVARICHVAPRTVSKWFDRGELRGYRIPGSRDRRIPVEQLVAFMRVHGIPLDALDGGTCRVLMILKSEPEDLIAQARTNGRYEIRWAQNGFEAGVIAQKFRPHAVVVESMGDDALEICRNIKQSSALSAAKVLAVCGGDEQGSELMAGGFDGYILNLVGLEQLAHAVENATNLMA